MATLHEVQVVPGLVRGLPWSHSSSRSQLERAEGDTGIDPTVSRTMSHRDFAHQAAYNLQIEIPPAPDAEFVPFDLTKKESQPESLSSCPPRQTGTPKTPQRNRVTRLFQARRSTTMDSQASLMDQVSRRMKNFASTSDVTASVGVRVDPVLESSATGLTRGEPPAAPLSRSISLLHLASMVTLLMLTIVSGSFLLLMMVYLYRLRALCLRATQDIMAAQHTVLQDMLAISGASFSPRLNGAAHDAQQQLIALEEETDLLINGVWGWWAGITVLLGLLLAMCSRVLGSNVSQMLAHVLALMQSLRRLEFMQKNEDQHTVTTVKSSWVKEVQMLETELGKLRSGVEVFVRFLPTSVVRGIMRGEDRLSRLHVAKRNVTVMFSDIKNFTSIAESLPQIELLCLLCRYLSIMTKIIEGFEGVIAEILGDGLLAFWNTPDIVTEHPLKACEAALAQQEVLHIVNKEFSDNGLPELSVRIGIHTGNVLTGNIGSESHMKFGCMGDAVNLASRLEGLCKFYGVSVLISDSVHECIKHSGTFQCRELDLVQVKGRSEPTKIYELMGFRPDQPDSPISMVEKTMDIALKQSTRALRRSRDTVGLAKIIGVLRRTSVVSTSNDISGLDMSVKTDHSTTRSLRLNRIRTVAEEHILRSEKYHKGLKAFQEGRFREANQELQELHLDIPEDTATQLLLERVNEFVSPDGVQLLSLSPEEQEEWTGVRKMTEK